MKRLILLCLSVFPVLIHAQDIGQQLKEADNLEKQLKEEDALARYKAVLVTDGQNLPALTRAAVLSCRIGGRQKDAPAKSAYYNDALGFATRAVQANAKSAEACFVMSIACGSMTELDMDKKKMIAYVKQVKEYADQAILLDPNHAKANYAAGKWHFEVMRLPWVKKTAIKALYGGLPEASMDSAILYMEKCRNLDPYFVKNYLDLAKAYQLENQPAKAIEVLNRLVKLPNRTQDDGAMKAEGKKLLEEMQ